MAVAAAIHARGQSVVEYGPRGRHSFPSRVAASTGTMTRRHSRRVVTKCNSDHTISHPGPCRENPATSDPCRERREAGDRPARSPSTGGPVHRRVG
ncbi:protein of unknown function [Blastococcus saxobsidens DD2]|uniref:Uncharacterized protein n=1 Tax=Blastococcus saxobsidens (strain DD2) TaxID=1146883 RepID=H6RMW9_BLASD|nr:protein of unknown function [Blastococcus saxobsidens DD2]